MYFTRSFITNTHACFERHSCCERNLMNNTIYLCCRLVVYRIRYSCESHASISPPLLNRPSLLLLLFSLSPAPWSSVLHRPSRRPAPTYRSQFQPSGKRRGPMSTPPLSLCASKNARKECRWATFTTMPPNHRRVQCSAMQCSVCISVGAV